MRKIGKVDFNLKGHVRRVVTERPGQSSGVVQDLQFDADGFLIKENSDIEITVNSDGIAIDCQKVLPDAGWALDNVGIALGTFVAVGTYGGWLARTTYDPRSLPIHTVFTNANGDETSAIRYVSDNKGRIVEAVQSLRAGFMSTFPAAQQQFLSLLGPDLICCRIVFEYDDHGRVTELNVDFMGQKAGQKRMTHNERGDLATVTEGNDRLVRYEYDYDDVGNWIRKVTCGPKEPIIETRRITYYP